MTGSDSTSASDEQVLIDQAFRELLLIESAVAAVTAQRLMSRWNRTVELSDDVNIRGEKPFTCTIRLNRVRMSQEIRWRTLIHEVLHAHSAGYKRTDFETLPGWEEGVVEQLQRLLRPALLLNIGIQIEEALFLDEERNHPYNRYIEALESVRQLLDVGVEDPIGFYISLLDTPIKDRLTWVMQQGKLLPEERQSVFLRTFALSNSTLRQPARVAGR